MSLLKRPESSSLGPTQYPVKDRVLWGFSSDKEDKIHYRGFRCCTHLATHIKISPYFIIYFFLFLFSFLFLSEEENKNKKEGDIDKIKYSDQLLNK